MYILHVNGVWDVVLIMFAGTETSRWVGLTLTDHLVLLQVPYWHDGRDQAKQEGASARHNCQGLCWVRRASSGCRGELYAYELYAYELYAYELYACEYLVLVWRTAFGSKYTKSARHVHLLRESLKKLMHASPLWSSSFYSSYVSFVQIWKTHW